MHFDHERMDVYQSSLKFLVMSEGLIERFPSGRSHLTDQMHRAAVSITLNIAEGAGEFSKGDKARFSKELPMQWPGIAFEPRFPMTCGCPTAAVCGYRTLEIENEEGEKFFVAYESCKSIVYGKQAFALSEHRQRLMELGVERFRIDLLTREYDQQSIVDLLKGIQAGIKSKAHLSLKQDLKKAWDPESIFAASQPSLRP